MVCKHLCQYECFDRNAACDLSRVYWEVSLRQPGVRRFKEFCDQPRTGILARGECGRVPLHSRGCQTSTDFRYSISAACELSCLASLRLSSVSHAKRYFPVAASHIAGDTWHHCSNCSQWPTEDFLSSTDLPAPAQLCNECVVKSQHGEY